MMKNQNFLTDRFEQALVYATQLHAGQLRKQSKVPYIAHLLGVASLVLEDGGGEEEAIAALLHDAVEDQGGYKTLEEIRRRFGERVAGIVKACTDSFTTPKPPWRDRKQQFIDSVRVADEATRRVALSDKIYNARSTMRDLKREGENIWERFNGGKTGTLWYYREMIDALAVHGPSILLDEFKSIVDELQRTTEL